MDQPRTHTLGSAAHAGAQAQKHGNEVGNEVGREELGAPLS